MWWNSSTWWVFGNFIPNQQMMGRGRMKRRNQSLFWLVSAPWVVDEPISRVLACVTVDHVTSSQSGVLKPAMWLFLHPKWKKCSNEWKTTKVYVQRFSISFQAWEDFWSLASHNAWLPVGAAVATALSPLADLGGCLVSHRDVDYISSSGSETCCLGARLNVTRAEPSLEIVSVKSI